jgi:hypothetical protein
MKRSAFPPWTPRYGYGDVLVGDLCAVADARARVELLPLPADESLRLRHSAYQRSTRIEGNPLDDQAVRVAIATGQAAPWTSTKAAMTPITPPGCVFSAR